MKKQEKPFSFRGKYFFAFVCCVYLLIFVLDQEKAIAALFRGGAVLEKVLPIFLVVIVLTSLLNYLLKPKKITAHLGEESGLKGWLWALASGVVSHGPMYIWYPFFEELLGNNVRKGLIVTFFASRTIKLPMLPMMIDYFGVTFTVVLTLYILICALIQGWLYTFIQEVPIIRRSLAK